MSYTTLRCAAGVVLVAATPGGVCAVYLGDRARQLFHRLRREFPQADLRRGDRRLRAWVRACVDGDAADVPVDVRGTPFQRRVWRVLRSIPRGQTRTYAEVARRLGRPGAARAVARACASNPVALLVPCHRVVRSDGSLGGYRWGTWRKRMLLEREAQRASLAAPERKGPEV